MNGGPRGNGVIEFINCCTNAEDQVRIYSAQVRRDWNDNMLWDKKARPAGQPATPMETPTPPAPTIEPRSGVTLAPKAQEPVSQPELVPEAPIPAPRESGPVSDHPATLAKGGVMPEVLRAPSPATASNQTVFGSSLVVKGDLTGSEDLLVDGQFEGTLNVPDHCVTIGPQGRVKAEVRARLVVIHGSVEGKVSARDKIDLRRSGNVIGDLNSASVSIEEGAYFKGSIEILREAKEETQRIHKVASASPSVAS